MGFAVAVAFTSVAASGALGGVSRASVAKAVLPSSSAVSPFDAVAAVRGLEAAAAVPKVGPAHWWRPHAAGNLGVARPGQAASTAGAASVGGPLQYAGGEIMPTTSTYVIFWLPPGQHYSGGTSAASDLSYENTILRYFQDVGGSQLLNVTSQYPGNNGTPSGTSTLAGSVVDTNPFPHAGTSADPLFAGDLNSEIYLQKTAHSWPSGMSAMYFILLPSGVVDCYTTTTDCNTNTYCAYHTYGYVIPDTPASDFIWADIPDSLSPTTTQGGCGDSSVSGNESADTTLSAVAHEHTEAITDPRLNAWYTAAGDEVADLCNGQMGAASADKTIANNYLGAGNADPFRIQRLWSNAVNGCAASYSTTGSHVQSPAPGGGDVILGVREGAIDGTPLSSIHYDVSLHNPSNQDDVRNAAVTITLPPNVQSNGSGTVQLALGNLAPHATVRTQVTAQPTTAIAPGTNLTTSASFSFSDSTGSAQPTITRTATTIVAVPATHLDVQAPSNVTAGVPFSVTVRALDASNQVVPTYAGTVHFTSSDGAATLPANFTFGGGDRGVKTFTNLFTLSTSGNQTVTATDTSTASINGSASTTVGSTADVTKPTVTITTPTEGTFYKQNGTVNAAYACQDEAGGSGLASCVGDVASGSAISTAAEGAHTFTVTAKDNAGNTAAKTVNYKVDGTAPTISVTLPTEGGSYKQGSPIGATFSCDDGTGSGVASCTATTPFDTSTLGAHQLVVHAVDNVGNATDKTVNYTIADLTNPTVTITTPADGAFYKQNAIVNAAYSCQDEVNGSGLLAGSCVGDVANGSAIATATEGAHSFTVTAKDNAGNTGSKTVSYKVDGTAPTITITLPIEGASYSQGAALTSVFACDDGSGSGVASCTATSPLDTSTPGAHSFVVHAVDKVGNATDKTIHYSVAAAPPAAPPSGGGGGAGGIPPDLHVDLTASSTTAPAVGSELLYTIKVSTTNVGSSSDVRLNVTLPTGFAVTRMYADRGPGCTGTAPSLVCDVAWISPGTGTTVLIWGTVGQAGEQDATATVTSLQETELAANLADNTTTLKLLPPAAPFTPPPAKPPVLKLTGRTPAAAHVGKAEVFTATLSLDKAATLKLTAAHAGSPMLTFLSGSKLGGAATGKASTQLTFPARRGGTVAVLLRIGYGALKRGQTYNVTIVATGADGLSSRLVIPFRR